MPVICIVNHKGGVGKTTTVAALGQGLSEHGKRVLLVDWDPQASLTISLGLNPDNLKLTVYNVLTSTIRNNGIFSDQFPGLDGFVSLPSQYPDDWNVSHHPFPEEVADFVDCILGDSEPELSIPRAAKTYEVIFAAELSAREGRPVKLPL